MLVRIVKTAQQTIQKQNSGFYYLKNEEESGQMTEEMTQALGFQSFTDLPTCLAALLEETCRQRF